MENTSRGCNNSGVLSTLTEKEVAAREFSRALFTSCCAAWAFTRLGHQQQQRIMPSNPTEWQKTCTEFFLLTNYVKSPHRSKIPGKAWKAGMKCALLL